MTKKKILYLLHNHPMVRPGGGEMYALELYDAMRASEDFEPLLVARMRPNPGPEPSGHPGTPFLARPEDPNQYFVLTEDEGFDFFLGTVRDKTLYTTYFEEFLRTHRPDIVHFQHTHFIGYDLVTLAARVLPNAPLVYTLHEYLPICHRDGQMLRTSGELCDRESPRRCNECFPHMSQQQFFLRKQLIQAHLSNVDLFVAPSRFLLERYVEWGIPREKITFEDYGRSPVVPAPEMERRESRNRISFFGQVNPYKGLDVLLDAMKRVAREQPDVHLWIHGANLDIWPENLQREFLENVESLEDRVTFAGPYERSRLPALMDATDWVVVPSRWWENSPLVIQEAFLYGRPVICSDVGGMAEKVTDGVNGLHFRAGDPVRLAETIGRAVRTPGLWDELRSGIPKVLPMDEHVGNLRHHYQELLERRAPGPALAPVAAAGS